MVTKTFCVLLLVGSLLNFAHSKEVEEPLIGWRGETHDPRTAFQEKDDRVELPVVEKSDPGEKPVGKGSRDIDGYLRWQQLSSNPRAFFYPNFLSDEECDHIIKTAIPNLKKSVVYDSNGKLVVDDIRTSYGTFLRRLQDPIIRNVTSRVAHVTHVPVSHQEDLQVLRYEQNEYYKAHMDSSTNKNSPRKSTMLLYLSDVEEGGETAFPKTVLEDKAWEETNGPFSECAKDHVAVKPHKGDAMLFYTMDESGEVDPLSKHMGCPVTKGMKWTATVWTHQYPYRMKDFHAPVEDEDYEEPGLCMDYNAKCPKWKEENECENNPQYMVGDGGDNRGHCRRSCNVCQVCSKDDKECYRKNRAQAGFLTLDQIFEMKAWEKYQKELEKQQFREKHT